MMAVAALVMSDSPGPDWSRQATAAAVAPASIAVLPFQNLSAGSDYFAEGVAEELLGQLSREPQLRVVGRTSAWFFKDKAADLPSIGRRLGVEYLLKGSVRRDGDQVKVDVALVKAEGGLRLWSHSFQGPLDDIFAIQAKIGQEVTGRVRTGLVPATSVAAPVSTTGEVYSLYLAARGLTRTRTPQNLDTAVELLNRAIRLDPNYAPGWAALGAATRLRHWRSFSERKRLGMDYVNRALKLEPNLAEAHAVMGMLHEAGPEALRHLERSVQLDPGNADAWLWLSNARLKANDIAGSFEAIRRMASIDPFWIRSRAFSNSAWGMGLREDARRFDERLIRDHPEPAHRELARARIAARKGDWSGYVLHNLNAANLSPDTNWEARRNAEYGLLKLDLRSRELPRRNPVTILWLRLAKGEAPPLDVIKRDLEGASNFWMYPDISVMTSRLLLNGGRPRDLLALYDESFRSPEAMVAANIESGFLTYAPSLIIALQSSGRDAEAARFVAIANREVRELQRQERLGLSDHLKLARVLAVQGKKEAALSAIERAVALGWPNGERDFDILRPRPVLAEEPAFRELRGDARFRRIDAAIQANLARERRELLAAAAQRGWVDRIVAR